MASQRSGLRAGLEYSAILIVLFLFFGGDKIRSFLEQHIVSPQQNANEPPPVQMKVEGLVYQDKNLQCPPHPYDIHVFSASPLIIYIPNFLSASECSHLVDISSPHWTTSTIVNGDDEVEDTTVRKSERAKIPRDESVQCIESRALAFQGWPTETYLERLWSQRYNVTGHYAHHYDWPTSSPTVRRVSTFMVYLATDCEGGGTNFPLLSRPQDERWCDFVDCDDEGMRLRGEQGVTFLPKAGAAVFWQNFDSEGRGWKESLHAGMPVTQGVKVGLNIWSWYHKGHRPVED